MPMGAFRGAWAAKDDLLSTRSLGVITDKKWTRRFDSYWLVRLVLLRSRGGTGYLFGFDGHRSSHLSPSVSSSLIRDGIGYIRSRPLPLRDNIYAELVLNAVRLLTLPVHSPGASPSGTTQATHCARHLPLRRAFARQHALQATLGSARRARQLPRRDASVRRQVLQSASVHAEEG